MPDHGNDENVPGDKSDRPSDRSARVARSMAAFALIRVDYAPQGELVAALDELRLTALELRVARMTCEKILMPAMRTIAEMGVGKTWAAEALEKRMRSADAESKVRPVLVAALDTSGTQASVPAAILVALKKKSPYHGTVPILWERAIDALHEHSVEMVVFDEANYAARRPSIGKTIGGDLMKFLTTGDVAVAFLGTEEADQLFDRAPTLRDRLKSPVIMKALDWDFQTADKTYPERKIFRDFLDAMDNAMLNAGLITSKAGIGDEATAKLLWEVCRGRLRPVCLLLEEASIIIHRRGGALVIDHTILAEAVENHSIPNGNVSYNPFTEEKPV